MRRLASAAVLFIALSSIASPTRAQDDPVMRFILAADSVHTNAGPQALGPWLATQPDLAGSAVAQLIDIAVELGDAGDTENEAGNLALVAALAEAAPERSALPRLLAEYRSWDLKARAARATAMVSESDAWSNVGADPDAALRDLKAADSVYERIGDSHSRARVWGRIGASHWYRGDGEALEAAYAEALQRRREVQDRKLEAATLNGLGSFHYQFVGNLEVALDWYRQAAALREQIGDVGGLATSLTYSANVLRDLGRVVEARDAYERALPVLESLGNPTRVVENLYGTADLYQTVGRSTDAIATYEEATEVCLSTEDCEYGPMLLVELAAVLRNVGRLQESTAALDRAGALEPDAETATRLWQMRSLVAQSLGDQTAARESMITARRLAATTGNATLECDTMILLSTLYRNLGALDRARSTGTEALAMARETGDLNLEGGAATSLASTALAQSRADEAIELYTQALAIDDSLQATAESAHHLVGRSGAFSLAGRFDEARADARRAAALFVDSGQESALWITQQNIADTFEDSDPDSAAHYYDAALSSLERTVRSQGGAALNTGYLFSSQGSAYEQITRYYAHLHADHPEAGWDKRAFRTAERSRARGLVELLEVSFADSAGDETDAIFDALYSVDASTAEGRAERNRLQRRLSELRAGHGIASDESSIAIEGLQSTLDPGDLVLQYAVGDSGSFLWAVTGEDVALFELPPRADLRRRVKSFRDAIGQPTVPLAEANLREEGASLYALLVAPAARFLEHRTSVVVVPDDILFELPFEALIEDGASGAWSETLFFGRDRAIAYVPSSTVLVELRKRGHFDYARSLVAIGDVDYSGLAQPLDAIPFTREEVEGIGKSLDDEDRELLLGPDATEARLRASLVTSSARVLHFATHGLVDPTEPSRSSVALGPGGEQDGYLTALEILGLRLDGPMVVLSACESALGKLERGEGVVGLTRSFLAAGSRGVVASLWPVSDASTAALMAKFYEEIWNHRAAPQALLTARQELLASETWSHPYFWSAFVPIGAPQMPW